MKAEMSEKTRARILNGLANLRDFKDDSTVFIDKLLEQSMQMLIKNSVPNEELKYDKEIEAATTPQVKRSDEIADKLNECSNEELEALKKKIAETERMRNEKR